MKIKLCFTIFLLAIAFTGCAKKSDSSNDSPTALTQDDQLAGFWKLDNPQKSNVNGMSIPRIMKFQINRNGLRQLDFCDLDGLSYGMSEYEIKDNNLVINYYGFQDSSSSKPSELPTTLKTFAGKITKLDKDILEINGEITYVKFIPKDGSTLSDNSSGLCKP